MNKDNDNNISYFVLTLVGFIGIIIGCILGYLDCKNEYKNKKFEYPTPVEKERIDTLYIVRDSLINNVKYLDSIKHDTITKVYNLNDSTTVQLFFKLVSNKY